MTALRKMRVDGLVLGLTITLVAAAGCGGDEDFANRPRPPAAVTLTGVIHETGVALSPDSEGAGPILLTIANETDESHTITLAGDGVEETVGPIQPRDTATVQKTLAPGVYDVRAGSAEAIARGIPSARLRIGRKRPSSSDRVLLP